MSLPRQRATLMTLGVADLHRARRFYAVWGWTPRPSDAKGVVFYQMHGAALALFPLDELAADMGRPGASLGTGAIALAQNCADPAETDAVWQSAVEAGATALKRPEKVFWGGYSGYVADPDGHVRDISHNPFWQLDADGNLSPEAI